MERFQTYVALDLENSEDGRFYFPQGDPKLIHGNWLRGSFCHSNIPSGAGIFVVFQTDPIVAIGFLLVKDFPAWGRI